MKRKDTGFRTRAVIGLTLIATLFPTTVSAQRSVPEDGSQIFLPLVSINATQEDQALGYADVAIEQVAERTGRPSAELTVVTATTSHYDLTNVDTHHYKIQDASGELYGVSLGAQGEEIDIAQIEAAEETAYVAAYGALDPELAAHLQTQTSAAPISVVLWLDMPDILPLDRPTVLSPDIQYAPPEVAPAAIDALSNDALALSGVASDLLPELIGPEEDPAASDGPATEESVDQESVAAQQELDAYFAQVDAHLAAAVAAVNTAVVTKLADLGVQGSADTYAPAVYASLTPAEIAEINDWSEVDTIYLDAVSSPDLSIARQTINAHTVNSSGYTGSGIRVAQVEVGGQIATSNPYLSGVTQNTTYSCSNWHATAVAGVIRSRHSTVRGIAPNVNLWAGGSCSGTDSQLQNRATAAADWGARIINNSWGRDTNRRVGVNDRFFDTMVINRYRTIVVSAGNMGGAGCADGTDGDVGMPALAYNVISVGNFDDRNSVTWSGDRMATCSSWRDPISSAGDREKPEVAAPGTNIQTTSTSSNWISTSASGTSFSAPMVAGGAALLMQRSSALSSWPEAVKAILMTSALHNVEGSARLSEKDGAGAIVLSHADNIARGYRGTWGAQSYSCSTSTNLVVSTMYLTGGRRFRATIAWDNNPLYSSYATKPGADLDLQILNSAGNVVASSSSYDNTYEIVDFTPTSSGTYRLQVYKYRCNYTPSWLGWAWYQP
ncbi:MAG: S8 family serine peptidase [Caldilineaceae bacterium]|nr:S8 family serine peptidase [Caldilineaceae bacterium]